MRANYDGDVVAWANEQAALLRAGKFAELDIEHIADEVEDVGKSERRELMNRMALLLAHLLKWQFQAERRGSSWVRTIKVQRRALARQLVQMPSLKSSFYDPDWLELMWADACRFAESETNLTDWPETCAWSIEQIMDENFFPE